eukprot:CAMPEP_0113300682 /NCGR_PEP_ID=MMETSP0010_2-20120614/2208_1 /TAXON_ID=216773 ORGANISM="Corethron hystrix, Strain 308" /NCGR_SAMPLE_ID=MMETSP0010_2 /ASSEMBLY_ACC=CAM_ASM_000155 /LENGTH=231 /DNA_ID=CAMNT_0000154143 /DNA_START=34 /DNA_END=729 /DNA_ORIENTATION=+ /assembly_acc=CAM_ASM_000155
MGQAMRMMKYPHAENEINAITGAIITGDSIHPPIPLRWHRLDDGVMGGKSITTHSAGGKGGDKGEEWLHFSGTINTDGGGFTSVRAPISLIPEDTEAIAVRYRGDGKTYKVLLSNGKPAGPFSNNVSWQADLPTCIREGGDGDGADNEKSYSSWEEATLPLSSFIPSFGGRVNKKESLVLVPTEQRQIGLMLSLYRSDGSANPEETFGKGEFDFKLTVHSIAFVKKRSADK